MGILNGILSGLTGYLYPIHLVLLLLCLSHLVLPLLALLNSGSRLSKKSSNHISFSHDWSYHLNWLTLIPATIMLISMFHGRVNNFPHGLLVDYEFNFNESFKEFVSNAYIPVICLIIASGISFLIYRVNRNIYIKHDKTTWWFPDPAGKPALSTVAFHIMGAIVGSVVLVYVVHHLAMCIDIHLLLRDWSKPAIRNMSKTYVIDETSSIKDYFASFVYPLAPTILLCCINIVIRMVNLRAKLVDPVIILTIAAMSVILILLYYVPVVATGFASKIDYAEEIHELKIRVFPFHAWFWGTTLGPIWSGMGAAIGTRIIKKFI